MTDFDRIRETLQHPTAETITAASVILEECDGCLDEWAEFYEQNGDAARAEKLRAAGRILYGRNKK
jgi:hypothetical protein